MNGDGTVHAYEMFECIVACENAWREEACPEDYPDLYCNNPYPEVTCEGAFTCDEMDLAMESILNSLDANSDGLLNNGDGLDPEHIAYLNE